MASILDRVKSAWNVFISEEQQNNSSYLDYGSYGHRPDRLRLTLANERSIIASIYNQIALDVATIEMRHVKLDKEGRYEESVASGLNNCLNLEANIDQAAMAFKQDVVLSLFEKGVIALVPIDTNVNPNGTGGFDILTMRVGHIVAWYPSKVKVSVWNDRVGRREDIALSKSSVAIVENPLYSVMNETNSTLQRLMRKLALLDSVDEQSSSGKLDMIIQLPYVIKSEARRHQAETRRKDIEMQLKGSQYGIAYIDGTEKVTQLNRPAENQLMAQVEYLTEMLYSQLGINKSVFDGTADEATMVNYHNRTVLPILQAIAEALRRSFLTKTARTQGQSVEFFRDPFKLVPVSQLAEIADKFSRNEIMASNEWRSVIGRKPSKDPKADELRNSNMPQPDQPTESETL